jgi:hypothetical protein
MATLSDIARVWRLTRGLHTLEAGVVPHEIEAFEEQAGWRLPSEWREFYEYTSSADLLKGNLRIYPLLGQDNSLIGQSEGLRSFDWRIPDGLWIAGADGEGYPFGLWQPAANEQTCPLVEVEVGTNELSVVATSLNAYLLFRTAYHLMSQCEGELLHTVLDMLAVPPKLRPQETSWPEADYSAIQSWADPDLRNCSLDLNGEFDDDDKFDDDPE